ERLEPLVHAGKTHVGHLIDPAALVADQLPDLGAGHLTVVGAIDLLLHLIDDPTQLGLGHRPPEARPFQPGQQLAPIPRHTPAIPLDPRQADILLDPFIGGEALGAASTFAPATNRPSTLAGARVDHLELFFVCIAERAVHE